MTSWVCLDAGIVLKLVLQEEGSRQASDLWQSILKSGRFPAAPFLFPYEITSVLRKYVFRGIITPEYGLSALEYLLRLEIKLLTTQDIHLRAWQLSAQLKRPAAYDAHYLALAEFLNCQFWTADRRLYNAASASLPWIRHLDELESSTPAE